MPPILRFFTLCLVIVATGAGAQEFSSLEERMSTAEFKAAGLDKLSPEELAQLNAYFAKELDKRVGTAVAAAAPAADTVGFKAKSSREPVTSRIAGEFTGWGGFTRFTLENGQVWKQIDREARLVGVRLSNPQVTIKPGLMGVWYLSVEGYNSKVKVERVE